MPDLTDRPPSDSPATRMEEDAFPLVSIVMPVRNEEAALPETLDRLAKQTYPRDRMEIIIVDGMSQDGTVRVAEEFATVFPRYRIIANPRRLSSSSRNLAIRASSGQIIAIVEGHCLLEPDFVERAVELLRSHSLDCLGRPIELEPAKATPLARAIAAARASPLGHSGKSFVYREGEGSAPAMSMATVYRRRVFDVVGFFDEGFDACEDLEFNWRAEKAGLRTYFSDRLRVRYVARGDLRSLYRQMLRYGRGRLQYVRKHAGALDGETVILPAFAVGILAFPLVGAACAFFLPPLAALFFLFPYALYAALLAGGAIATAARRGWTLLLYLPAAFFTIHFGLGAGFLSELFRRRAAARGADPDTAGGGGP